MPPGRWGRRSRLVLKLPSTRGSHALPPPPAPRAAPSSPAQRHVTNPGIALPPERQLERGPSPASQGELSFSQHRADWAPHHFPTPRKRFRSRTLQRHSSASLQPSAAAAVRRWRTVPLAVTSRAAAPSAAAVQPLALAGRQQATIQLRHRPPARWAGRPPRRRWAPLAWRPRDGQLQMLLQLQPVAPGSRSAGHRVPGTSSAGQQQGMRTAARMRRGNPLESVDGATGQLQPWQARAPWQARPCGLLRLQQQLRRRRQQVAYSRLGGLQAEVYLRVCS